MGLARLVPFIAVIKCLQFEMADLLLHLRFDIADLQKFRKYKTYSVRDLLRAIRNKVSVFVLSCLQMLVNHLLLVSFLELEHCLFIDRQSLNFAPSVFSR